MGYVAVGVGFQVLHGQIFHLRFYGVQSHAVGKGSIYINSFAADLKLFFPLHAIECPHIMQAVGELYEDHPWIISKGEQDLFEILSLLAGICVHHRADLRKTIYDLTDLRPKFPLHVFEREIGVFHGIVKEGADGTSYPETNFFYTNFCHRQGMQNVRLSTFAPHRLVCIHCHFK